MLGMPRVGRDLVDTDQNVLRRDPGDKKRAGFLSKSKGLFPFQFTPFRFSRSVGSPVRSFDSLNDGAEFKNWKKQRKSEELGNEKQHQPGERSEHDCDGWLAFPR